MNDRVLCIVCGEQTWGEPIHDDCDDSTVLDDGRGHYATATHVQRLVFAL